MMNLGAAREYREEDFRAGKAWVHPETCLEYEDFGSWLAGEAPLRHLRNEKLKTERAFYEARARAQGINLEETIRCRAQEVLRLYGREGPYSALHPDTPGNSLRGRR